MAERAVLPLPLTIEEIDRDWLTAALRQRAPGATVRGFEVTNVVHSTCTKLFMTLELDEAARRAGVPARVMLKGGFEPHSREMCYMHENEVQGYRRVFPELQLPSPACYFAEYDPDRRQGIVILEDLSARGATFFHARTPQTYEAMARRLTTLAQFHARTWGGPEQVAAGPWGWLNDYLVKTVAYADQFLQTDAWWRYVEAPRGAAASVRFHDPEWLREGLKRMAILGARRPHCVVHGDTHLGNTYADADGSPGFFDPTPHRGPAGAELAYLIPCALDTLDRPRWERGLVAHYLDELARNGIEAPSLDEMMRDYGAFLARAYFVFIINSSVFLPESYNTAYVARISAAMIEHDTIGLLQDIR